jgi:hypothetical protein
LAANKPWPRGTVQKKGQNLYEAINVIQERKTMSRAGGKSEEPEIPYAD